MLNRKRDQQNVFAKRQRVWWWNWEGRNCLSSAAYGVRLQEKKPSWHALVYPPWPSPLVVCYEHEDSLLFLVPSSQNFHVLQNDRLTCASNPRNETFPICKSTGAGPAVCCVAPGSACAAPVMCSLGMRLCELGDRELGLVKGPPWEQNKFEAISSL